MGRERSLDCNRAARPVAPRGPRTQRQPRPPRRGPNMTRGLGDRESSFHPQCRGSRTFRGVDQRLRRSRSDTRSYSRRPAERSKSLRLHRPHLLFLDSRVERRAGRALSSTNRIATRASHSKFAASGIPALGRTRYLTSAAAGCCERVTAFDTLAPYASPQDPQAGIIASPPTLHE
jgi:hypothetical protein